MYSCLYFHSPIPFHSSAFLHKLNKLKKNSINQKKNIIIIIHRYYYFLYGLFSMKDLTSEISNNNFVLRSLPNLGSSRIVSVQFVGFGKSLSHKLVVYVFYFVDCYIIGVYYL